jgi:hypothetical protein
MKYALPAIIAMTATSLYNIADSIFIGHGVGALAISGLAITFPLMNLAAAFGSLVGVGASTLISVKLGQKYGQNGYLIMTDEWFNEYMFRLVVNKKYASAKVLSVLHEKPIRLPAWDPMFASEE